MKFGKSGYSFVLDLQGNIIVNPLLQGKNTFEFAFTEEAEFVNTMISKKRGQQTYFWRNPGEKELRRKIVVYDYVPEVGWIVASSAYLDDLYEPLKVIRNRTIVAGLFCLLIGVVVVMLVSASITNPIRQLVVRLSKGTACADFNGRDEVAQLAGHFDRFLTDLELEARERLQLEQKLSSSQERYRAVMEAAPDPIMVLDLEGEVSYLNHAFMRVFGWTQADFSGDLARAFVPPEERVRSRHLLTRLLNGVAMTDEESLRVTQGGGRAADGQYEWRPLSGQCGNRRWLCYYS